VWWVAGSLCVFALALRLIPSFTTNITAAILMTLYLQAARLTGAVVLFRSANEAIDSGAQSALQSREGNAVESLRVDTSDPRRTGDVHVQAVWVLNRVATLTASTERPDEVLNKAVERWRAHQVAHARSGHGWFAIVGESVTTFLVMWLFMTIGPIQGIFEILFWVLALLVAISIVDSVLRAVFDAMVRAVPAGAGPVIAAPFAAWRDIAVNPPVCRSAGGVIRTEALERHDRD
jgi:hypothetical protein